MKLKFGIGLLIAALVAIGFYKFAEANLMKGDPYYVQITTDGEKFTYKADNGQSFTDYRYQLTGYDENGKERALDFNANRDRPLRKSAYLRVSYNTKKQEVTQWEEVQKEAIPAKALAKLE